MKKEMIKRADGSVSQRGLWDNIRANKGSGKKPTAAMLKQEKKIKARKPLTKKSTSIKKAQSGMMIDDLWLDNKNKKWQNAYGKVTKGVGDSEAVDKQVKGKNFTLVTGIAKTRPTISGGTKTKSILFDEGGYAPVNPRIRKQKVDAQGNITKYTEKKIPYKGMKKGERRPVESTTKVISKMNKKMDGKLDLLNGGIVKSKSKSKKK